MDEQEDHECFHCGQEFSSATEFKIHLESHSKTATPSSSMVDVIEPSPGVLDGTDNAPAQPLHVIEPGGEPHECFHCGEEFSSAAEFKLHLETHTKTVTPSPAAEDVTGKGLAMIDVADKGPGNTDLAEPGEDPHECFHCGEEFSTTTEFKIHLETHIKKAAPSLAITNVTDKEPGIMVVTDTGPAMVDVTDQAPGNTDLAEPGGEPQECFHCGEEFSSATEFKIHLETHTKTAAPSSAVVETANENQGVGAVTDNSPIIKDVSVKGPAVVNVTDNTPGDVLDLVEPIGEPHECFHCGEEFTSTTDYKIHLETHTKTAAPSSAVVDMKDKGPGVVTVTDKGPTIVSVTGSVPNFSEPGGDPHECFHCGEEFSSAADYKIHLETHKKTDTPIPASVETANKNQGMGGMPNQGLSIVSVTGSVPDYSELDGGPHECFHCGEEFSSATDFKIHMETHKKTAEPSPAAVNMADMGPGVMTVADNGPTIVTVTGSAANSVGDPQECFHCGEEFSSAAEYKIHMETHKKTATPSPSLVETVNKDHDVGGVTDQGLSIVSVTGSLPNFSEPGGNPFECFHCGEEFSSTTDYKIHLETHTKTVARSPAIVDVKDQGLGIVTDKGLSIVNVTGSVANFPEPGGDPQECIYCGEEFSSTADFKIHMETHKKTATPSPALVETANKDQGVGGVTDQGLSIINVTGSVPNFSEPAGEPHECFHCGEEFSSATDYKIHLETHKKTATPSPPAVDVKAKAPGVVTDKRPGDMVDLTEPGGEPHECFHCGAGFYSIPDLDEHMKVHAKVKIETVKNIPIHDTGVCVDLTSDGDDPHECFHCGEEFDSEDLLNSHLVTRHQVKPHRCVTCGDGFMHEHQLKAHELIHKGVSSKVLSDVQMMYRYKNSTGPSTSTYEDEGMTSSSQDSAKKCTICAKTFSHPSDLIRHMVTHTGEKPHACHLCPKKFAQTSSLYSHLRQSHRTGPHVCSKCGEGFHKMADLRVHQRSHHTDKPYETPQKKPYLSRSTEQGALYKCAQCGDSFNEKTDLDVHSQIHMRDTIEISPQMDNGDSGVTVTQKCPRCSGIFGGEADLNRHIMMCIPSAVDPGIQVKKEYTGVSNLNVTNLGVVDLTLDDDDEEEVNPHKCTQCDKTFSLELELNSHMIMFHSTPDSHECFHCGEEFDKEDDLKLHILRLHGKTKLQHHACPDCDKTFLLQSDFENHKKQKHPACTICGHKFSSKSAVERHMKIMHDGVFTCNYCRKTFHTVVDLQAHKDTQHNNQIQIPTEASRSPQQPDAVRSHEEVQQYKCLQCDKSFTSKPQLYKHCQTHLDPQPQATTHKCYCGMQFSNPDNLERHKETHSDVVDLTFDEDDTYKCSLCDDVYSREEELIVHMMTHPKQEPFECPECGKKFVFEKDYRFHLRTHVKAEGSKKHLSTHTGDKPHKCPVCPKRFASLAVLQRHEATHGSEPHKCQHCGAGFWQIYYLRRHLEKECSKLRQGKGQNGNLPGPSSLDSTLPKQSTKGKGLANNPIAGSVNGSIAPDMTPIKAETYTCCGWSFMSEADMKVHELSHKVTVYKCVHCKQVFRSPAELETHVKTHTEPNRKRPYQDDSSNSSTLTAPSTSLIEEERHPCLTCGKEFRTEGFLNKHMLLHKAKVHKADVCHRCNECGQKFLSLAGLTRHALTHADNKPNQCPVCNENFNNSAKLFEHMATHDRKKTHSCTHCGKTFKRVASLNAHMRMHNEEFGDSAGEDPSENVDMDYIVHKPNIPLPNIREPNGSRPAHIRKSHPIVKQEDDEDIGLMCTFCGRKFKEQKSLKVHFRTHMKSTSSTYYETKVKFEDAAGKELRIVTRVRKKRCKCYICFKMFRRPSDLARHMMIHTGERPCKCAFCPAGFILLYGLKKHTMKFHKDIPPRDEDQIKKDKEKADNAVSKAKKAKKAKDIANITKFGRLPGYLCCGTRFMTYLEIQHHWLVHKEAEPYACPHCDKTFTKGFCRTKHVMRMHSGTKPNCLDCGKEFARFPDLIVHMKVHEEQMGDVEAPSTTRVEVYTDVADGEPADDEPASSRVEVYTDVADTDPVSVKAEFIPDEKDDLDETPSLPRLDNILDTAPDPLLLKREGSLDSEIDPDMEVDSEVDPVDPEVDSVALKKEGGMDTLDDPSSPIDDAVLDSEPEEQFTSLKEEAMMDTDPEPAAPTNSVVPDAEAVVEPSSPNTIGTDSHP